MSHILDSVGHRALLGLLLALTACGAEGDTAGGGSPGGGNVGFGGAQDIGQFRDIIERGGIPGIETLDAAGFFAEHYSELPPPACDGVLCPHAMLAIGTDWLTGGYQSVLQIALNTPIDPATLVRKPLDLVLVVDVSGSMLEDDRIGYVRQGLHLLADELDDVDRVALVTYSDWARVVTPLGPLDRPALHAAVDRLVAGGSTNIYDGLSRGFAELGGHDGERQRRVMLLSDGLATAGVIDDASIIALAEGHIATGVGLTTIGVGNDFNVNLMRGLAERGAGNFYYLESPTAIAEVFGEELDYFVEPLALEVTIELSSTKAYRFGEVVGTRLWQSSGTTGTIRLPAVFVASRTSDEPGEGGRRGAGGSLFVDMAPVYGGDWGEDANRVAALRLTYRLPGETTVHEERIVVDNPLLPGELPADAETLHLSHEAMSEHYAMYNVFRSLRHATYQADFDYHCALGTLERLAGRIAAWNLEAQDPDLAADLELVGAFAANLRALGARPAADSLGCPQPPPDYDGDGYPDYGYDGHYHPGHCSATGRGAAGLASWLLVGLAVVAVRRRR
jgi:Ca-activated chloride channel homolog